MKNVQISLMIFILSLLLLSCSQSIFQTVTPTKYSLHFTHTLCHVQSHINIAKYVQSPFHSALLGRSVQQQYYGGDKRCGVQQR